MGTSEKWTFPGHDGTELAGRLDLPDGPPKAIALFAHCFSCSKDVFAASRIASRMVAQGYGILRFDFTGLGASDGEFENTNFSSNVADLIAASRALEDRGHGATLLIGHSLGGAAVIVAASQMTSIRAVVTIGAPSDADHVLDQFAPYLSAIETDGVAEVKLAGRPFRIQRQFVEDVRGAKVRDAAAALKRPLLVMHSPFDEVVSISNATGLFIAAKHPKSFFSLDHADHLLTGKADAFYAADTLMAWAGRYVMDDAQDEAPKPPRGRGRVYAEETGNGPFENWLIVGDHVMKADEPASVGGGDSGPDPYELLGSALATCTSMTIRMYASRKNIPLEKVSVSIEHARDHASDCVDCGPDEKVDIFEKTVWLTGADLTAGQRARLMEIADMCPVHRTLHSEVVIRSTIADT